MNMFKSSRFLTLVVLSATFLGCGDVHQDQAPVGDSPKPVPKPSPNLISIDSNSFANHILGGLRSQLNGGVRGERYERPDSLFFLSGLYDPIETQSAYVNIDLSMIDPYPLATRTSLNQQALYKNYSTTAPQYATVENRSSNKHDGKHWFMALQHDSDDQAPGIKIVATKPDSTEAKTISTYALKDSNNAFESFYLVSDSNITTHVAAITHSQTTLPNHFSGWHGPKKPNQPWGLIPGHHYLDGPISGSFQIELVDVSKPAAPKYSWHVSLDGVLVESRKIGNILYVVSRYDPWVAGTARENTNNTPKIDEKVFAANRQALIMENEKNLALATYRDLVPHITVDATTMPLTDGCLIPAGATPAWGVTSIANITTIDLAAQKVLASTCIHGDIDYVEVMDENLYVIDSEYFESLTHTIVHKFSLANTIPIYKASGRVEGTLEGAVHPAFRIHESGNDLRLVTARWGSGAMEYFLHILEDTGSKLVPIAKLPNSHRPTLLGSPMLPIKSVRFEQDAAYFDTFEPYGGIFNAIGQSNLLYKIDLSDRTDPKLGKAIQQNGIAASMYPIGEHYFFSLGVVVTDQGLNLDVKAELIDASGSEPKVVQTIMLGTSSLNWPAMLSSGSISVLEVDKNTTRIAFLMRVHRPESGQLYDPLAKTGLQLFEVNGVSSGNATLTDAGFILRTNKLSLFEGVSPLAQYTLLHGDVIYSSYAGGIWASKWDAPEEFTGPLLNSN